MLKIDVDIGRFISFFADEPLKQHVDSVGINRRDSQAKADCRIRGRSTTLTQNATLASEAHQIPHGQKVGRVVQFADQIEFVFDKPSHLVGHAARVTVLRATPRQVDEMLLRSQPLRAQLFRVVIPQFVERKLAAISNLDCPNDSIRAVRKERSHFACRFEMPFRVGETSLTKFRHGAAVSNRGHDILQRLAFANMTMHIVRRHERQADLPGVGHPLLKLSSVIRTAMQFRQQVRSVVECFAEPLNVAVTLRVTSRR